MSYKVFIGVGHCGKDSGAAGNGLKEKYIVLNIALEVGRILENHNIITKSRERDEEDTVGEEVREENAFRSDIAIDIHINEVVEMDLRPSIITKEGEERLSSKY